MELLLLIIIAGVAGYLLAGSRFHKNIDSTSEKVADSTRKAADSAEGWVSRTFGRNKKPKEEVVDAEVKASEETKPAEEVKSADKQPSRRKSEEGEASE
jgi:hypothetical protein